MAERLYLNDNWVFCPEWSEDMIDKPMRYGNKVRIPHSCKNLPFHYFEDSVTEQICAYQCQLAVPQSWRGKRLLLTFEGAAHKAKVYCNGSLAGEHSNGYTAFTIDVSSLLSGDAMNLITVLLDCRRDVSRAVEPDVYACGGLIRDVYLDIKNPVCMERVFYRPSLQEVPKTRGMSLKRLREVKLTGRIDTRVVLSAEGIRRASQHRIYVCQFLNDKQISNQPLPPDGKTTTLAGKVKIWDTASPYLYEIRTEIRLDGEIMDSNVSKIGFRRAEWKKDSFFLNGRTLRLRGLNRYQVFPYTGYAMPAQMQHEDARILKNELGCNVVRTADGPPASAFLDGCDKEGVLSIIVMPVLVSGKEWEESQSIFTEMYETLSNHPSVILWETGLSGDSGYALYPKWEEYVHRTDSGRQLAGRCFGAEDEPWGDVCIFDGEFNEDEAIEPPRGKGERSRDKNRQFIFNGYGGYRCPARITDSEDKKRDQMLYHASMMNAIASEDDIAGAIGSCMCDYPAIRQAGDLDGICYFGVMDAFRNPKPAAFLYKAQAARSKVCEVFSDLNPPRGANMYYGYCYMITSADKIKMWTNGKLTAEYNSGNTAFTSLRRGPILIDEYVNEDQLEQEGITGRQARLIASYINERALNEGIESAKGKLARAQLVRVYHMTESRLDTLYRKYIRDISEKRYRFGAFKNGEEDVFAEVVKAPASALRIVAVLSSNILREGISYDVASVRVSIRDENGNAATGFDEPMRIQVTGEIGLIGPDLIALRGGYGGFYVRSEGRSGSGRAVIRAAALDPLELDFEVVMEDE